MDSTRNVKSILAACLIAVATTSLARAADPSPAEAAMTEAARDGRYSFVMFHSRKDAATNAVFATVTAEASKFNAAVLPVNVGDQREKGLIDRFDATRMPMPSVAAIAPNGAVTGVFPLKITAAQVASALASPGNADCIKGLQSGKLVLLCVHPGTIGPEPVGVQQFAADPHFRDRTWIVHISGNDPREAVFVQRLGIPANAPTSTVAFMAPPGVMVGKFNAKVPSSVLAGKLAEAGKCCDDPNCKHQMKR